MPKYKVIYEDPNKPNEPVKILIPSDNWLKKAMDGDLPPIWVIWELQEDEQKAIDENRHKKFKHDPKKLELQFTAPRVGPLTEEEAMMYLVMKDIPKHVWSIKYNRPMFKIVRSESIPTDRYFRNAWKMVI